VQAAFPFLLAIEIEESSDNVDSQPFHRRLNRRMHATFRGAREIEEAQMNNAIYILSASFELSFAETSLDN
jgi:hypothetical protein